ncbi:MAG: glycosyl transferase, family 2 [Patescibacteria group bacterium]|jgi:glycosyltransferase involved in cell wall biosynthesis|nr:glycosyl transferase, family 2 [Patescibacteria group bacterium]
MLGTMETKISVCIITKNEEKNIERCLRSVSWADELIVVDSGSTDNTVALAKECGATVTTHEWKGWAIQKNHSISLAGNDWILSLDADEWLEPGSEGMIRKAISNQEIDAYTLSRKTLFLGKWIANAGWYPDRQIRLFKKSVTKFSEVPVHEKVIEPEHFKDLNLDIMHESYTSIEQFIAKSNAYSSAQALQQKDQSHLGLKLIGKPVYRFLQTYVLQKGFLDGKEGFFLAVLRSWYEFVVIAKIISLYRQPRQEQPKKLK